MSVVEVVVVVAEVLDFRWDSSDKGMLTAQEVRQVLKDLSFTLSLSLSDQIVGSMDVDRDGFVSFQEFRRCLRENSLGNGQIPITYLDIINYCNAYNPTGYIPVFVGSRQIGYIGESIAAEMLLLPVRRALDFSAGSDICQGQREVVYLLAGNLRC
eukprot:52088-Hanusia_phi.AAC.1